MGFSKKTTLALAISSFALTGCFSSSSSTSPTSEVRVFHAASDAPQVNITANGNTVVEGADYLDAAVLEPNVGTTSFGVDALLPGGETATVIGPADITLGSRTRYDVVAIGSAADETLDVAVFEEPNRDFSSSSNVRLRVAHLADFADETEVDVYLSDEEEYFDDDDNVVPIEDLEPALTFEFGDRSDALEVPAGTYWVRVAPAGSDDEVYNSGGAPLPAGADLMVAAVINTGANQNASPISLSVLNDDDVDTIFDVEQQAGARVVHASGNAPEVDVFLNDEEVIDNLAFPETDPPQSGVDSYLEVEPGTQNIKVAASGDEPEDAVIEADLEFNAGEGQTILAVNVLEEIEPLVLQDSVRSIATQASLRVVHGASQAPDVNVFLLPEDQDEIGNADPVLEGVPFKEFSDYLPVAAGIYNVRVTDTDGNVAIEADDVEISAGGVYTIVARDGDESDEELTDFGFILLDDFTL